ncbi:AMP-dependent synthetase/ligase [Candidatus Pelagibacter sp. HIMB1321]|uniref:AMP-dependent synthetase/ligase n=1 Tax=Candidatus Pelagibacter sp. HIMB1321 TaxID=1388755 RepID=UPI000A0803DC|nr:long-chain fatty acid--CoA ligase [Candidatus Pelagibacter sp. HIMB1321]SMF80170.1 long-chain acyl-CoA synthetase [Candidatus Pelagibacter sp. HIMB1321]
MKLENYNNLLELFFDRYQVENKNEIFLQSLKNQTLNFTWKQTFDAIQNFSFFLDQYISHNDRCLLISENRPEWLISDLAIMLSKGISVPAYTTYVERDYEFLIEDCKPSVVIVSDAIQFKKINNLINKYSFIKKVISFENIEDKNVTYIEEIFRRTYKKEKNLKEIDISRKDISCIIYTSGTQGNPKGVMLSHGGILNNCEGSSKLLREIITTKPKFLTWLPLSHSYEHTVQFVQIAVGARIFYAESIDKLVKNMNDCNPDIIMTAVPRFYQNLYQKITSTFKKATGVKKFLINSTLQIGRKNFLKENLSNYEKFINLVCDKLVRKKIKSQFGGNLKAFISGGGALDYNVGVFLNSIGLPTLQGYGLTETSPVVSCNPINDIRIDTVGPPFEGNDVKIADDGEILVKGENVMLGYWNNTLETNNVIKNGWLHTGDIGILEDGFLKITDRKKDILITPGGDNISPVKIEGELTKIEFIEQALVYGDNKPFLVALIVVNNNFKNIDNKIIEAEIEKINKQLSKIEKIKKFFIIDNQFSIENGYMTPTLKLKRFKIIKEYKKELENLY